MSRKDKVRAFHIKKTKTKGRPRNKSYFPDAPIKKQTRKPWHKERDWKQLPISTS